MENSFERKLSRDIFKRIWYFYFKKPHICFGVSPNFLVFCDLIGVAEQRNRTVKRTGKAEFLVTSRKGGKFTTPAPRPPRLHHEIASGRPNSAHPSQ
jgi:hypothetical protein